MEEISKKISKTMTEKEIYLECLCSHCDNKFNHHYEYGILAKNIYLEYINKNSAQTFLEYVQKCYKIDSKEKENINGVEVIII